MMALNRKVQKHLGEDLTYIRRCGIESINTSAIIFDVALTTVYKLILGAFYNPYFIGIIAS